MPHTVDLTSGDECVVKHFTAAEQAAHERELAALTVLAEHAPGLAPRPLPHGVPPVPGRPSALRMTRLPGSPLRGARFDARRTATLATAVGTLLDAVPPEVLAAIPPRPDGPEQVTARLHAWAARGPGGGDPLVAEAAEAGLAWLASAGRPHPGAAAVRPVFGAGDGNLANYLDDGTRVRVVDFEFSGRSDRPYELAEITEHVSAWSAPDTRFPGPFTPGPGPSAPDAGRFSPDPGPFTADPGPFSPDTGTGLDAAAFLAHFDLTAAEAARLAEYRRLLALTWLFLLSYDDPAAPRNPPGTARRQARRVLDRLNGSGAG